MYKSAYSRSVEISEEERRAALNAKTLFEKFKNQLISAREGDHDVVDVLVKNKDSSPQDLFQIRQLLRDFQKKVKDKYTRIILDFSGAQSNGQLTQGYIHSLRPLEKDTRVRQIKVALQDAMQQLTEFLEEFLNALVIKLGDPDQIKEIISTSQKADQLVQSIENIIDKQLVPHFDKNILIHKTVSSVRCGIKKRARLMELLEE